MAIRIASKRKCLPTWIHGDLHPRNVLAQEGQITGIIDWGDISSGDPATDLASVWMLLSERITRERALFDYGADANTVLRAKGWAVFLAVMLLDTGILDHPRHAAIGYTAIRQLREDYV
ncbi:MAG: phosphotransferase [Bryobacteraceae bacterium]